MNISRLTLISLFVASFMVAILQCDAMWQNNMDVHDTSILKRRLLAANAQRQTYRPYPGDGHYEQIFQTSGRLEFRPDSIVIRLDNFDTSPQVPTTGTNTLFTGYTIVAESPGFGYDKNSDIQKVVRRAAYKWRVNEKMADNDPILFMLEPTGMLVQGMEADSIAELPQEPYPNSWEDGPHGLQDFIGMLRVALSSHGHQFSYGAMENPYVVLG